MQHCVTLVKNPVDGVTPIQIRIGINSGPCVSGVVGMSTPKYTVFGDTVNCASRHESTGLPGRTQISSVTRKYLTKASQDEYNIEYRGIVAMKGKGDVPTYWLNGARDENEVVGRQALESLRDRSLLILSTRTFTKRRYFQKTGLRTSADSIDSVALDIALDGLDVDSISDDDADSKFEVAEVIVHSEKHDDSIVNGETIDQEAV